MLCAICSNDNWHSVGNVTENKEEDLDLLVCRDCGFVGYKQPPDAEQKMRDFYRFKYRGAPGVSNLLTTTNKQNYIMGFLAPWLEEREKRDKRLVCGDVGCATGYLPGSLRKRGHRATGSELTVPFRRFAEHFYGVPVTEELETKHKYDLITLYHVLEHLVEPDKKLAHYVSLLKDDGRIMVSTPEWFGPLEVQSGEQMKGRWHYWHKNHINCFSRKTLQNLFKKCGLEVERVNTVTYGQTYLLKKGKARDVSASLSGEDYKKRVEDINTINEALDLFKSKKYREAIQKYPDFPEAYIQLAFGIYGKERDRQRDILAEAFGREILKNNARLRKAKADWLYQGEEFQPALEMYQSLYKDRPTVDVMIPMAHCLSALGDHKNAAMYFYRAAEVNPMAWQECMDKMCHEFCQLPAWDEVARQKVKEHLFKQAGPVLKPKDPVMDAPAKKK